MFNASNVAQWKFIHFAPFITKGPTGINATCPVLDGSIKLVKEIIFFQNKVSYVESANY